MFDFDLKSYMILLTFYQEYLLFKIKIVYIYKCLRLFQKSYLNFMKIIQYMFVKMWKRKFKISKR